LFICDNNFKHVDLTAAISCYYWSRV